jgi:hypothetical protein
MTIHFSKFTVDGPGHFLARPSLRPTTQQSLMVFLQTARPLGPGSSSTMTFPQFGKFSLRIAYRTRH